MKFMRLGSRPDCFSTRDNVTSANSELESDIVLDVDGHKFHLHLFPLLAKCGALNHLLTEAVAAGEDEVKLEGFPGSAECFEICAKFCYSVTVILNAHNVSAVRCGAEFLKMSESVEKGNLVYKLDVFLTTSILRGWRDAILCLQSSQEYHPWVEDLKITNRCIEAISSKVVIDPAKVDWSFSYTRASMAIDHVSVSQAMSPAVWNGLQGRPWLSPVPQDWWLQDISDLDMELFQRVMVVVKAKGMAKELVGEALRVYATRWLPGVWEVHATTDCTPETTRRPICNVNDAPKHRQMVETIVGLLPGERGASSCTFFLKLLKAAAVFNASVWSKTELARRIGVQLEEAELPDLFIPSLGDGDDASPPSLYDVDLVMRIVEHYLLQNQSPLVSHGSKVKVAKLIDGYLAEIARDASLSVAKFMQLAEAIPDCARPFHDGLYRAVDMYLKEHPGLAKGERKKVCRLMDCRKLSMEACMHAAQNDRLPLRTVVQVLFFEQVRTAATGGFLLSEMPGSIHELIGPDSGDDHSVSDARTVETMASVSTVTGEGWDTLHHDFSTLKGDLVSPKTRNAEVERECHSFTTASVRPPKPKSMFSKPKKFFQKLFSKKVSNSASSRESDSHSPMPSSALGKTSTRMRRHSIT